METGEKRKEKREGIRGLLPSSFFSFLFSLFSFLSSLFS
jgi:hypothetical protein